MTEVTVVVVDVVVAGAGDAGICWYLYAAALFNKDVNDTDGVPLAVGVSGGFRRFHTAVGV